MADEQLPKEELLRKMLNMTTSDNDGQALVAIRKANALLSAAGWSWDKLLAGKIKIVESPFKNVPNPGKPTPVYSQPQAKPAPMPVRSPRPTHSAGAGRMWQYSNFSDSWESVLDPSYAAQRQREEAQAAAAAAQQRRGLRLNRTNMYANHCYCCGDYVKNQDGFIMKPKDFNPSAPDKWAIVCTPCNNSCSPDRWGVSEKPAARNTGQTTVRVPAPDLGKL